MSIWDDIEAQKEDAKKDYKKVLKEVIDDPLEKYFKDSKRGKIPIEYHTEASSKPVYHPLVISRVLVYFNPQDLREKCLKQYSFGWFGMTLDTLKKYVENGWIIVQLNTRDKYKDSIRKEIEEFFRETEAKPIYVHIIEQSLLSTIGYENITFEEYLEQEKKSEQMKNLEKRWHEIIKRPIEMYGVEIKADKVMDHYIKLKLLRDVFREKGYEMTADAIDVELKNLAKIESRRELAQRTYTSFLIYGTPIFYCKCSGFVSVGSEPFWYVVQRNTKTIFGKIKEKFKEDIESKTIKNKVTLYFEDIDEHPHKIIKKHYFYVKEENIDKAKELEGQIIKMINEVYQRCEEKGDYIKAFESFMNEGLARLRRIIEDKILIPASLSTGIVGCIGYDSTVSIIGVMLTLTSVLTRSKRIETIALKCVARNKIFELRIKEEKFGVEIKEEEIPDMRIKTPKPYEEFRYRVFRIPVKEEHHTSEKVTIARLKELL